jgi:putative protease
MGVKIGKVIDYKNNTATIKLTDTLKIGSGLRVLGKSDVGINVNDFYKNGKLVKEAHNGDIITIKVNALVEKNSDVLVTLDSKVNDEIGELIDNNTRKVGITAKFIGKVGNSISLYATDGVNEVNITGNICESSLNRPTIKEDIESKLCKLGDSIYKYDSLDIEIDNNIFIPLKEINELRRKMTLELNKKRLYEFKYIKGNYEIDVPDFKKERLLSALVVNTKDIDKTKYDIVYSEEGEVGTIKKLPRVIKEYNYKDDMYLVGEIGAFNKYKNVCTDFALNVVNSYTVAFLHSIGAKRITLSYELNFEQIKDIIDGYHKRYNKHPNLELIVSANEEVMVCKFNLSKYYNNKNIYLRDRFSNIYKLRFKDDLMYIYNYKRREDFDTKYYDIGINTLRYNFDN